MRASALDSALDALHGYGPDLRNGLTSHAPMVAEALAALGRDDAIAPWLERYRAGLLPRPAAREPIGRDAWPAALGREDRFADWSELFVRELAEAASWRDVVRTWAPRLAPAHCASAAHGVIRAGHAVRGLGVADTEPRRRELADGLAYWAAAYQTLPASPAPTPPMPAADAFARVPVVPPESRRFDGTIVSSLAALTEFAPFAPVIGLLDVAPGPAAVLSELTRLFAGVFLANARDTLGAIVFVHAVTSAAAVRSLLPYVDADTASSLTRHAWQTGCALYATFGGTPPAADAAAPTEDAATLVDMAIANGDDHAIKLAEACVREHRLAPSPVYLAAVRHALALLPPA